MDQQRHRLSLILVVFLLILGKLYGYYDEGFMTTGDVLIAFKTNLTDSNNRLKSWNTSLLDPCKWQYVTCDRDNNVVMVDLHNLSLPGQLVPELGQLTYIKVLQLSGNNITGRIPDELGNLPHIRVLDFSFNQLNGEIPNSLGKLRTLLHLFLNDNTLTGSVPVSLTAISKLEMLDVSNNNLSGHIYLNGSFSQFPSSSFAGNPNLRVPPTDHEAPMIPRSRSHSGTTTALAIGVCVGVGVLVVGITAAYIWYCCGK